MVLSPTKPSSDGVTDVCSPNGGNCDRSHGKYDREEDSRAPIGIASAKKPKGHLDGTVSGCADTTLLDAIMGDMASPVEGTLASEGNDNNAFDQLWENDNISDTRMGIIVSGTPAGSPKTPMDTDFGQTEGDEIVEHTTIERIGWMPAYDVAYVKRLEYDRSIQNSKDARNEQIVKHCQFLLEANPNYHLSILQTKEENG